VRVRALGFSERRALLDAELERLAASLDGVVFDVGGRGVRRGHFVPPKDRCKRWVVLNLDAGAGPDVVADANALPLRDAAADWVLCLETLQYVERPEAVMAEFVRVLGLNGRLVLSIPFLHRADTPADRYRLTAAGLEALAALSGLQVITLSAQGFFFTTLANFLRQVAAHIRRRPARAAAAAIVIPLTACLRRLDTLAAVRRSRLLSSFTTGFLLVARKR